MNDLNSHKEKLYKLAINDDRFDPKQGVLMDLPHIIERVRVILDSKSWDMMKELLNDLEITNGSITKK